MNNNNYKTLYVTLILQQITKGRDNCLRHPTTEEKIDFPIFLILPAVKIYFWSI